jgi:hypothetical protein
MTTTTIRTIGTKFEGFMQNAYECKEEFGKDGKCLKRERAIGPIVPWSIVALVALLAGKALVSIPPSFWEFLRR